MRQEQRDRLNTRKKALTVESSARWANAIIAGNDAQFRLARDAQHRHIIGLQAAIAAIEKRLAQPTASSSLQGNAPRAGRPNGRRAMRHRPRGFKSSAGCNGCGPHWPADRRPGCKRVHVAEGGKRLANTRHNLDAAHLTLPEWREDGIAPGTIEALGSGDEPFGNLTVTVTPDGEVTLPAAETLGAPRQRHTWPLRALRSGGFLLSCHEWRARITGGESVAYTIARKRGRDGRYLIAAWA